MSERRLPKSFLDLEKKITYQYRYDKAFCQYLDMGDDPSEAAEKAHALAIRPLDFDFGPYEEEE
jgi:hypothetical protein